MYVTIIISGKTTWFRFIAIVIRRRRINEVIRDISSRTWYIESPNWDITIATNNNYDIFTVHNINFIM